MQPLTMRRVARRAQPTHASPGLVHTSTSAASAGDKRIPADYLRVIADGIRLSQEEAEVWSNGILLTAQREREVKAEARRQAVHEAHQHTARLWQMQQTALAHRDSERRAQAAARSEIHRQEQARIRREHEEAEQRRRDAEEATRRAAEESERRRRERLRRCVVCLDEVDFADLVELPCSHWSCPSCLRGTFQRVAPWGAG
jgi:hypothetical protein